MKRPFWITLLITSTVSVVALFVQGSTTRNLSQRLAEEKAKASSVESKRERDDRAPFLGSQESASLSPESEERVESLVADLEEFIASFGEGSVREEDLTKKMPELLELVKGLSPAELIAAAERLPSDPKSMPRASSKSTLALLAAEQNPTRVYQNENLMKGVSTAQVLGHLARTKPGAALRELPPMEPRDPNDKSINAAPLLGNENLSARIRFATMLLGVDVDQGLKALLEVARNNPRGDGRIPMGVMGSTGIPSLPEESIPGLISAIDNPAYAEIRPDIIDRTILDGLFKGGVATVAARMATMKLSTADWNRSIDKMLSESVMESEPETMLDWVSKKHTNKLPSALIRWAETDVNAAAAWLGQQEPTDIRDKAISAFAVKANKLDPEAAATWALEIQDEKTRQNTLSRVVKKWKGTDAQAAENWINDNGISL